MAKPTKPEKVLERTYVIPLRRALLKAPRYKRAKKAVRLIREFLVRHMKVPERDVSRIRLDPWLNRALWLRGIKKPPYKITVKALKDSEGNVRAELVGMPPRYKVEEAELLRKKAKLEARAKRTEEERKKLEAEQKKKEEEAKKRAELEAEAKKEKAEEEKAEEKEKKEREELLHKELPKPKLEELGVKHAWPDGKREKQERFRKALEK